MKVTLVMTTLGLLTVTRLVMIIWYLSHSNRMIIIPCNSSIKHPNGHFGLLPGHKISLITQM